MVSQSSDVVNCFMVNTVIHITTTWIHGTSEHEVVPNQQSLLITKVIENIILKLTTSPYSDHIIVSVDGVLKSLVVDNRVLVSSGHEHIRWDVVSSLHENIEAIEIDHEGGAISNLIFLLDNADGSDTSSELSLLQDECASVDGNVESVEVRLSQISGPPENWIVDGEWERE